MPRASIPPVLVHGQLLKCTNPLSYSLRISVVGCSPCPDNQVKEVLDRNPLAQLDLNMAKHFQDNDTADTTATVISKFTMEALSKTLTHRGRECVPQPELA